MDLSLSAEDIAFRDEVRRFLASNVPDAMRRAHDLTTSFLDDPAISIHFHRALDRRGWSVPHWPVEHGGTAWTPVQHYIFDVECGRAGAPVYNSSGSHFVGPVIMHYGTAEQKAKYLPRIRSGEDHWAQGYSEPGSGSDLASLKTRADSDGDDYIVNGQKIWTTHAHKSNRIFALVRTSREGKRQAGITFLLMDLDRPGITVRPIIGNGGDHEFNEVFFDNVRTPKSGRVGEENHGWEIAKYLLEFERGGSVIAGRVRAQFAKLVRMVGARCPGDPGVLARMAEIGTDLDAMEMLGLTVLSELQTGGHPGPISSLLKLRWSEIRQSICELALDAIGDDALRWIGERPLYENLQLPQEDEETLAVTLRYLNSRAYTIMGGTSEIQTNILAKTLVGL
ncbi:MAG TPA: acyl-CoA dehydrogenase family protein [Stellaceae bacterium]|nr:acyl-CoA dehydrogenase family protein [Stellaceae bacterium]